MHIQEILTAAIVAIPTAFFALSTAQFIATRALNSKRPVAPAVSPIAPVEPQATAAEPAAEVTPDVWGMDSDLIDEIPPVAPAAEVTVSSDQAIALLPAFIPNAQELECSANDHTLVESAWICHYCNAGLEDVVVPFVRPTRAAQKRQEAHPAIDAMTVHQMRKLATRHYRSAA
jgi:hypothetical protein